MIDHEYINAYLDIVLVGTATLSATIGIIIGYIIAWRMLKNEKETE